MKRLKKNYKRLVVKIGSSLFTNLEAIEDIIAQVSDLVKQGIEVIIVSSGAIACGLSMLGLKSRPKTLSSLQAAAAIGQNELMNIYRRALEKKGLNAPNFYLPGMILT